MKPRLAGIISRRVSQPRTPLSPEDAGANKSFNGKLRDEKLNETLFTTLHQVRVELSQWKHDYNTKRPHSALGWLTPSEFASRHALQRQWPSGAAQLDGSAPMAIAQTAQMGINNSQSKLKTG